MTYLLTLAIEAVQSLPETEQDAIARQMLTLAQTDANAQAGEMDPAHEAAILEALEQVRRGEFASEEEVEAAFRSFG